MTMTITDKAETEIVTEMAHVEFINIRHHTDVRDAYIEGITFALNALGIDADAINAEVESLIKADGIKLLGKGK